MLTISMLTVSVLVGSVNIDSFNAVNVNADSSYLNDDTVKMSLYYPMQKTCLAINIATET